MCDLTQFVISSSTTCIQSETLAQLFMVDVLLTFGVCSVVVIDDGSTFKGAFISMCTKLKINHWCLTCGNHRVNSVERCHRYLNKTQAIAGNDRCTNTVIIQNSKTSQYAWNSAPIDNTDITRSMAAVGREFRFPLDVDLSPTPTLNNCNNSGLFQYLRNVGSDAVFASSVLSTLIEERRATHQARHNRTKEPCALKVGDVVKAHTQI